MRSNGCSISVDVTPPETPATRCSYLTWENTLIFILLALAGVALVFILIWFTWVPLYGEFVYLFLSSVQLVLLYILYLDIYIYLCIYLYIVFLLFTIFGVEFDSQIELKSQKLVAHGSNAIFLVARCRFGTVTTVLVAVVVLVAAAATVVVAAATANTYTFLPLFCCCRAHIFSLANFSCFF